MPARFAPRRPLEHRKHVRIGLERDDIAPKADITPKHGGVLPRIRAHIDHAINAEMRDEAPQRNNLSILMLAPKHAKAHRQPAISQFPAVAGDLAHAAAPTALFLAAKRARAIA